MDKRDVFEKVKGTIYLVGINIAVFAALFVLLELALHIISPDQNPLLGPPFVKSKFRIAHPVYSHTLLPNYDGEDVWGTSHAHITTNSLGFKDGAVRDVPLRSNKKRVLFLGDSFTEGIGLPYEQTFVGRFAAHFPQLDVLNGAVVSYAPSVYYAKTKYLLESGLHIDEVIVYIDISDIQDEAIAYRFDNEGNLKMGRFDDRCPEVTINAPSPPWTLGSYTLDLFYKRRFLSKFSRDLSKLSQSNLMSEGGPYARNMARSSWTYDANSPCYGNLGVEGGIAKAVAQMDKLYALLSERGIPLSVGVYPWPQQLLYDTENSRQARIWDDWCRSKCRRFFNHFPAFFAYKQEHETFIRDLFIWGDSHYNQLGNEILARDLISQYP
ncbi:MAG: hypothetical protein NVSMB26_12610 [Beijerinckiaceae bacterium]